MERETKELQVAMQSLYGEEYRRKWIAFTAQEMLQIWTAKIEAERIQAPAIRRLIETMDWPHPPTLPQVLDALHEIQRQIKADEVNATQNRRLADDAYPRKDSPVVQEAFAKIRTLLTKPPSERKV